GWTVRRRLAVIVGLTLFAPAATAAIDLLGFWRANTQLGHIESSYVPLLTLGPQVEQQFDLLSKRLEGATSAKDPQALAATAAAEQQLLAAIDGAPAIVERPRLLALRRDTEAW